MIIEHASKPATVDIELLVPVQPGTTNRVWMLEGVHIPANACDAIRLSVDPYGGATVEGISSSQARFTYSQESLVPEKNFFAEEMCVVPGFGVVVEREGWIERRGRTGE